MSRLIKGSALVLLSVSLLSVGIWITGVDKVLNDLRQFPVWSVFAVITAFVLNLAVVSFRLGCLLKYLGINVPYEVAFRASVQGHFASLFLISLLGQVAGRHAVLRHYGTPSVFIAALTAIERVVLFIVSGVLCLLGAVWLLDTKEITDFLGNVSLTQIALVTILSLFASLWFGRSRFEVKLLTGIRSKHSLNQIFEIARITFVAQFLVLGAFVFGAAGLTPEIGFWNLLAASAITSFAASLPISVNGWGVREIAAIFAFGHIGMPPSSALAISILVGLCSTAVVLAAWPFGFNKNQKQVVMSQSVGQSLKRLPIEKTATWGLVTATAIFIFFQIHVSLHGSVINLNLADAFAVIAFSAVLTHSVYTRELPQWIVPRFNILLLLVGSLLLLAFLNGVQVIGVTQWALAGRLIGWLVLLGYLSVGALTTSYLGKIGVWRFIETLIATAVIVVLFHAITRWLFFSGWIALAGITLNFEGFSGNRNAFAFQLLTCSVLLLAYVSKGGGRRISLGLVSVKRDIFLSVAHGVILAGIVFTGSRAGMLTGAIIIIVFSFLKWTHSRVLAVSTVYAIIVWLIFTLFLPLISHIFNEKVGVVFSVQSVFSGEMSNIERWETISRGFEMWRGSPWFGAGLGVFIETSTQWFKQPTVIHSTPVWIIAEFGLFGAIALLVMLSYIIFHVMMVKRQGPSNRAVIMLLIVFLIFGLVHEIFYQRIFWLALGVCVALPFRDIPRQRSIVNADSQ